MPKATHRLHFTTTALDALPPAPPGRRVYYSDSTVRGLQLAVTDRGAKTFYYYARIKGRPYRDHLGVYPGLTVERARKKARISAGRAAMGEDLRAARNEEKRAGATLADAFAAYKVARMNLKASTLYSYERFYKAAFEEWQATPLRLLTKDKVAAKHRKLTAESGPAYADGAMRFLRAVINFAQYHYEGPDDTPLLPDNPVRRLSQTRAWNRPKRRTTYVTPEQLKPWFAAVLKLKADAENREAVATADWLLLMILTGLRRSEALQLRWEDVNLASRILTVRDTKNHDDHTLPLSDYLQELLRARMPAEPAAGTEPAPAYVFASYGREGYMKDPRLLLEGIVKESGVSFTPHDLRRTFITVAEYLGVRPYVLKRLLNHKQRSDITAGYIVLNVEKLRDSMQQVTDFMLKCAGLKPSADVIAFGQATAS